VHAGDVRWSLVAANRQIKDHSIPELVGTALCHNAHRQPLFACPVGDPSWDWDRRAWWKHKVITQLGMDEGCYLPPSSCRSEPSVHFVSVDHAKQ
jgi:hypothetical protein